MCTCRDLIRLRKANKSLNNKKTKQCMNSESEIRILLVDISPFTFQPSPPLPSPPLPHIRVKHLVQYSHREGKKLFKYYKNKSIAHNNMPFRLWLPLCGACTDIQHRQHWQPNNAARQKVKERKRRGGGRGGHRV